MAWTVKHSHPKSRTEQEAGQPDFPNLYRAIRGREEALEEAERILRRGETVWCIEDDAGDLVMDREGVWRTVFPNDPPGKDEKARR